MCCPLRTRSTNGLLTTSYYVHACSSDYPWLSKYSVLRTNTTTVRLRSTKKSFLHLTFPGTDRVQSPRSHIDSVPLDVLGSIPEQSSRSFCKSTNTVSRRQSRFLAVEKRNVQNFGRFGFVRLGLVDHRPFGVLRVLRGVQI